MKNCLNPTVIFYSTVQMFKRVNHRLVFKNTKCPIYTLEEALTHFKSLAFHVKSVYF